MSTYAFILLALALSLDIFVVSVTRGMTIGKFCIKYACKFSFYFGLVHSVMFLAGWLAGLTVRERFHSISHIIAFILLFIVGSKMIYESFSKPKEQNNNSYGFVVLTVLALATSIDALSIGVSFSLLGYEIVTPVIILGITTFIVALVGVYLGERICNFTGRKLELLGGLILIAIGFYTLFK